jgi:predicted outer membrane repeat protein
MGVVGGVSYEVQGGTASFLSANVGTFGSLGITGGARFNAGTFTQRSLVNVTGGATFKADDYTLLAHQLHLGIGANFIGTNFRQQAGSVNTVDRTMRLTGTYSFNAGTFNVTPPPGQRITGGLSCATFEYNNAASFGGALEVTQGLSLNVASAVVAGDLVLRGGSFPLAGNRSLHVRQDAAQIGGSVAQAGSFSTNGVGQINVIPGTLRLGGGATWTQTGGQNFGGTMIVGAGEGGDGTYTLNAGSVNYPNGGAVFLGDRSDGTFVQNAGTVAVGGLVVGGGPSASFGAHRGTYVKNGGVLGTGGLFAIFVGRDGSAGGAFTHAGGTTTTRDLTLNENATNHAVFTMTGGTLNVSGRTLSHGTFNQTGGVATFEGNFDGAGTVSVTGDATLLVLRLRQNALHVGGNARVGGAGSYLTPPTHRVQALSFEDGSGGAVRGLWSLRESDLVVDYTGASPIQNVKRYLTSGYAGGSWNGTGLQSPGAPAQNRALGFAEASDVLGPAGGTFGGVFADATSVLVKYTRYGDANLDGIVNLQDFNRLAGNFGGSNRIWSQGDFSYDGLVNLVDFNRLASNFGLVATGAEVTPADWAALAAAVPEPGAALVAGAAVGAAGLRRRSRR